jgi:ferredoxin
MDKAVVAVFSGTGNARRAAGIAAEELEAAGRQVGMVDLAAGERLPELGRGDLLVLCSSTLGFSVPAAVMDAIKAAPRSDGAQAAALCVCGGVMNRGRVIGGWSGAASIAALGILRRKGWEPVGSADASYPMNWTQVGEAAKGADQAAILQRGDGEAKAFGRILGSGGRVFLRRNLLTLTVGRFVGFMFRLVARRILGIMYIADDTCTSCGFCERTCPSRAIVMHGGRPSWTLRCMDCNRCINACPSASIQTSTARLVLFAVLNLAAMVASPPLAQLILRTSAPALAEVGLVSFLAGSLLYIAVTLAQLGPLDALLRALERKPAFRRFFTANFTKRYARYLAPGFKPPAASTNTSARDRSGRP